MEFFADEIKTKAYYKRVNKKTNPNRRKKKKKAVETLEKNFNPQYLAVKKTLG
jgi:hypothetical protein